MLLEKPEPNSTLQLLSQALDHELADNDDECRAWAERTKGDVLFRLREYTSAATHYDRALSSPSLSPELLAVIQSDCGAAKHMAGEVLAAQRHYQAAVQSFPDLTAHHVLGTMGTVQYGEDARIVIEKALKHSHAQTAERAPSHWHQALHGRATSPQGRLFAARGIDDTPGLDGGPHPCSGGRAGGPAFSIALFCRLRGQTPGTAEQVWSPASIEKGVGGSEEAAIYLSRQLAALGYCVRVYGNPAMEEWGADAHGVVWLPFYAYRSALAPAAFVSWRNFDAVWLGAGALRRFIWVHDPLALASDQVPPCLRYRLRFGSLSLLRCHLRVITFASAVAHPS